MIPLLIRKRYSGNIATADVYVSQNLTGQALITLSTAAPADGDTVAIAGYNNLGTLKTVTFTFKTTLGSTAGNVLIGGSIANSCTNLAALINAPGTTTANGVALSTSDQFVVTESLKLAATATSTTVKLVGKGAGRLVVTLTFATSANATLTYNLIHCYYGKKGAIDYVLQDISEVDMRKPADRRGTNVFSSYLGGIKTFADGARKFLDVWIAC